MVGRNGGYLVVEDVAAALSEDSKLRGLPVLNVERLATATYE
jgi:hypothetical protein